jgi:LysM repeat protein
VLTAGEVIYLKKKAKKATKEYKGHIHYIQAGESMYSISQKYGIRVMYLYKINGLTPDYRIKVGDGIRVR